MTTGVCARLHEGVWPRLEVIGGVEGEIGGLANSVQLLEVSKRRLLG